MELVRITTRPIALGELRAAYAALSDPWRRWRLLWASRRPIRGAKRHLRIVFIAWKGEMYNPFPPIGHLYVSKVTLKAYWNPSLDFPITLEPLRRILDDLSLFYGNLASKPMATYGRHLLASRSLYGSHLQLVLLRVFLRGHLRRTGLRCLRVLLGGWRQVAEDAFLEEYLASA